MSDHNIAPTREHAAVEPMQHESYRPAKRLGLSDEAFLLVCFALSGTFIACYFIVVNRLRFFELATGTLASLPVSLALYAVLCAGVYAILLHRMRGSAARKSAAECAMTAVWSTYVSLAVLLSTYFMAVYETTLIPLLLATVAAAICCALFGWRVGGSQKARVLAKSCLGKIGRAAAIATVALFLFAGVAGAPLLTGSVVDLPDEQRNLDANIDSTDFILSDEWNSSSTRAKVDALQALVRVESRYLEVPESQVRLGIMAENLVAGYSVESNSITLNIAYLHARSGEKAVSTIAHEMFHAYQHDVVQSGTTEDRTIGLTDEAIEMLRDEFSSPRESSKEPTLEYYAKASEQTARQYSEMSTQEAVERVQQYRSMGGGGACMIPPPSTK